MKLDGLDFSQKGELLESLKITSKLQLERLNKRSIFYD